MKFYEKNRISIKFDNFRLKQVFLKLIFLPVIFYLVHLLVK